MDVLDHEDERALLCQTLEKRRHAANASLRRSPPSSLSLAEAERAQEVLLTRASSPLAGETSSVDRR